MNYEQIKLKQRQALSLESKIVYARRTIIEWYNHWQGAVSISCSGGIDSDVMADLVWSVYPSVPAYFADTGLEFPENRARAKELGCTFVRPKKSFLEVVKKYGYPVISKRQAQYIREVQRSTPRGAATKRLRLTGIRTDGTFSPLAKIPKKWQHLCESDIKISDECCKHLKKGPLDLCGENPFIGVKASDSHQREQMHILNGCNAYDLKTPRSHPLAIWTDKDVRDYVEINELKISKAYALGYESTGCVFCMFGLQMESRPDRFDKLSITHPKLFKYCMDGPLELRSVIKTVYDREYEAPGEAKCLRK